MVCNGHAVFYDIDRLSAYDGDEFCTAGKDLVEQVILPEVEDAG